MTQEFLTVSELNNFIRDVLSSGFPRSLWVCGEIQGYDRGRDKKHVFFEFCEKDPESREIVARSGLVIFANVRPKIESILSRSENAFALKDDIEVKFLCKVDFYPGHGQIRLIVEDIDPVYTLGKIAQDRQRLINALKQKGVLDQNKRLTLSQIPLRVGLVTSYDSAAYHDFIDELRRSGFGFKVFVMNALMQGKNTESSVIKALRALGTMELDVLVITRGGGSIAELSCFDSALIAEAIAKSSLPVVSGIGHEINTTVTDLAAHTFAKTPTAIAQFLISRVQEYVSHMDEKQEQLIALVKDRVEGEQRRLNNWAIGLKGSSGLIKESKRRLVQYRDSLKKTIQLRLQNSRDKIANTQKLVEMADPKNTLKRGFSITRDANGKTVRSIKDIGRQKTLTTVLTDGHVVSDVVKIIKE